MRWDTVILNDELPMLECRMMELDSVMDRFVVVEARETFQGQPKPLHLQENLASFVRWKDKLVHVVINELAGNCTWDREAAQRESILIGLADTAPKDRVFLSDVDEIPNAEAVIRSDAYPIASFTQKFYSAAVDWRCPTDWIGTSVTDRENITSVQLIRTNRELCPKIEGGGWHFTWIGGRLPNLSKLRSFSHDELLESLAAPLEEEQFLREGKHVTGMQCVPVDVDETYPRFIRERLCPKSWFRPQKVSV